jgi:hypothetical protein
MNNINYQNYLHYKLPITINPLEYGKLIEQIGNKYIIQLSTLNVAIIKQINNENFVKFFRKGELMFEFKDIKRSDTRFVRTILDQRFTFENNKLISTEILSLLGDILIYPLYEDTDAIQLKQNITPSNKIKDLLKYFSLDYICSGKYGPLKFVLFKLTILLLVYIIFWVIFTDDNTSISLAAFSMNNIIKLRKVAPKYLWKDVIFDINNKIFSKILFEKIFNQFWDKIEKDFTDNNHMFILFKIKYVGSDYATIGNLQRLNKEDKDWYFTWIINNMILKSEYYNETSIVSFLFSYGFKNEKLFEKETINSNVNFQKYENNKLVISYNPLDYGKLILKNEFEDYTQFILQTRENLLVKISKFEEYNEVELVLGGESILKIHWKINLKNFCFIQKIFLRRNFGTKLY